MSWLHSSLWWSKALLCVHAIFLYLLLHWWALEVVPFLATVNCAVGNRNMWAILKYVDSESSKYPHRSRWARSYGSPNFNFWVSSKLTAIAAVPVDTPSSNEQGFLSHRMSTNIIVKCLLDNTHSDWGEVQTKDSSSFYFPLRMLETFSLAIHILISFINSVQMFCQASEQVLGLGPATECISTINTMGGAHWDGPRHQRHRKELHGGC